MEQLTAHIAGWEHMSVDQEEIDKVGLPFVGDLFEYGVPAEVDERAAAILPAPERTIPIDRISGYHCRSYEVGKAGEVTGVWADRYGNKYTSLSYKGNNFSQTGIIRSATAPSGFIPLGLQEDDALLRVIKSSRMLREHGISTEWIVGVVEPKQLIFDGEPVGQREYKKKLLETALGSWSLAETKEIAVAIEPMTFFVTARCMEINDRPLDFLEDATQEQIRQRLHKVFAVYNLTHREDPEFHELDANVDADCQYYFTELLPSLQGRNLARLHNIGLVHIFPVPGNVTALGGVVDLDSIHGQPLGIGDKAITVQDMAKDMTMVFENGGRSYLAMLRHLASATEWFTNETHETLYRMQRSFWDACHQQSSHEFSGAEQCLMLLGMNRSEHQGILAGEMLQQIREALADREALLGGISEEFTSLVAEHRRHREEFAKDYATDAVYLALENGMHPGNELDTETYFTRLTTIVREAMEADAIAECIEAVANGGASRSFDTFVGDLGITGEDNADMRTVLARALLALDTSLHSALLGNCPVRNISSSGG